MTSDCGSSKSMPAPFMTLQAPIQVDLPYPDKQRPIVF